MIHRDHSAEAAAPGGERQGRLTLYPGFLNTDCRFGCTNCNPSWYARSEVFEAGELRFLLGETRHPTDDQLNDGHGHWAGDSECTGGEEQLPQKPPPFSCTRISREPSKTTEVHKTPNIAVRPKA